MKNIQIKTEYKLEQEARDLAVYNEYTELIKQDGAMAKAVEDYLMEKYSIYSKSTIWFIRKRVEKKLGIKTEDNK